MNVTCVVGPKILFPFSTRRDCITALERELPPGSDTALPGFRGPGAGAGSSAAGVGRRTAGHGESLRENGLSPLASFQFCKPLPISPFAVCKLRHSWEP